MLGGFLNVEGVDLRLRGKDPTVIPVDRLGIPTYDELVLVANSDRLEDEKQNIRLFIAALERGTKAAVADPAAATEAVLDAGEGLSPKFTAAEVRRTLPLLLPKGDGQPYGYMDPEQWQRFAQFFADHGLIEALPSTRRRAHQRPAAGQGPGVTFAYPLGVCIMGPEEPWRPRSATLKPRTSTGWRSARPRTA